MSGYSDIIYIVGAIVIYSLLSLQVNRMIIRNDMAQMESTVRYHVSNHAQNYADQIHLFQNEDEFDDFLDDFPRVDSIAYDENEPTALLAYYVNIEASDTTLPNSSVTSKVVNIRMSNEYLEDENISSSETENSIRLKLIKSFDE